MTRGVDPMPDDELRAAVSEVVCGAGFDLEDVTLRLTGSRRLIRVVVDRDGGVGLDAAAALSRDLGAALDGEYDAILGDAAYTLEVTSRGVGAPLTEPRHFRRAAGRLVTLTRADGSAAQVRIGRVDAAVLVALAGADAVDVVAIPLADIVSAKVEPEFASPSPRVVAALAALGREPAAHVTADDTTDNAADEAAEPEAAKDKGDDAR